MINVTNIYVVFFYRKVLFPKEQSEACWILHDSHLLSHHCLITIISAVCRSSIWILTKIYNHHLITHYLLSLQLFTLWCRKHDLLGLQLKCWTVHKSMGQIFVSFLTMHWRHRWEMSHPSLKSMKKYCLRWNAYQSFAKTGSNLQRDSH